MKTTKTVRGDYGICAFCKSWYDPTNMYIEPKSPTMDIWIYESTAKCKCLKRSNLTTSATHPSCKDYECRVPLNRKK